MKSIVRLKRLLYNLGEIMNNKKYILILLKAITIFFTMVFGYNSYLVKFDKELINFIQGFENQLLTSFYKGITDIADTPMSAILTTIIAVILFFTKRRKEAYFLVLTMVTCGVVMAYVKEIFERPRPDFHRLIEISGLSFPSGHTTSATIMYLSLALIFSVGLKKLSKSLALSLAVLGIFIIATSRVYLGVHYPTDTIAGMSLGTFVVTFYYVVYYKKVIK